MDIFVFDFMKTIIAVLLNYELLNLISNIFIQRE